MIRSCLQVLLAMIHRQAAIRAEIARLGQLRPRRCPPIPALVPTSPKPSPPHGSPLRDESPTRHLSFERFEEKAGKSVRENLSPNRLTLFQRLICSLWRSPQQSSKRQVSDASHHSGLHYRAERILLAALRVRIAFSLLDSQLVD